MGLVGLFAFDGPPSVSAQSNSEATGAPTISGTAQVGQTLTVDTSGIVDADGLTGVIYTGKWFANEPDDTGQGGSLRVTTVAGGDLSYTVSRQDVGKTLKIEVVFTDDASNEERLTSAKTAVVAATTPAAPEDFIVVVTEAGHLAMTWNPPRWDSEGEMDGEPTWGDGGSPITGYVLQWKEASESWDTEADVSESTTAGSVHIFSGLPSGTEYAFRVFAVNSVGRGTPSEVTIATNTPATGTPTISGNAQVGQTLTADTSGISDADGLTNPTYGYQWLADDAEIDGATSSTYIVQASDNGKVIKVRVSFTDNRGVEESLTSEGTATVVMGGL